MCLKLSAPADGRGSAAPALVGGQAVIEGVMMRARRSLAVAVRRPGGEVVVRRDSLRPLSDRIRFLRLPLVRGAPVLVQSLVLGIRALNYSASQAAETPEEQPSSLGLALATAAALAAGAVLFFSLPLLIAQGLRHLVPSLGGGLLFNGVDGLARLAIFLAYLRAISSWSEIRRVFEYHGAEHMAVSAYEHGEELTVESARKYSPVHPRCGTSFLLVVMAVSILLFTFLPAAWPYWAKLLARLALIPAIAGLSYEIVRLGASARRGWGRALNAPGLWLQGMTTRVPTDVQIEVALRALREVLEMEGEGGTAAVRQAG